MAASFLFAARKNQNSHADKPGPSIWHDTHDTAQVAGPAKSVFWERIDH